MNKQQILEAVHLMPTDIEFEDVIDTLQLLRKIEIGLQQAGRGEVVTHEEVKRRFLKSDA